MMIISRHIETQLNYRTTVSLRSDFLHINGFPEVYHGGEISAAVVTPASLSVVIDSSQTYASKDKFNNTFH